MFLQIHKTVKTKMKHLVVHSHISLNITRLYIFLKKNVERKTKQCYT